MSNELTELGKRAYDHGFRDGASKAETDTTHEGWSNRATWCVALHINNDQGVQEHARAQVDRARKDAETCSQVTDGTWKLEDAVRYLLADRLKDWIQTIVTDSFPNYGRDFAYLLRLDLLTSYLAQTNWDELARSFLESETG